MQSDGAPPGDAWVPLQLALGLPLVPEPLNELVCKNAAVRPPCQQEHYPHTLLCIQGRTPLLMLLV